MKLSSQNVLRQLVSEILRRESQPKISECIIAGGQVYNGGDSVLVKSRDRNYPVKVKLIRKLLDDGTEIVYMIDLDTNYIEGMNSHGIGIINSALLVTADETAADDFFARRQKKSSPSKDGPRIHNALKEKTLARAIKELVGFETGLKGHTMVGDANSIYSIEMTSKHNPIVKRLDSSPGFDVRTNHGNHHTGAGYTPETNPEGYMSSKIRKASAEVELSGIESWEDLAPSLAKQPFDPSNPHNMMRRTDDMRTSSQAAMNLSKLEFLFYVFPDECEFKGLDDQTADDHDPLINIRLFQWNE